MCGIIAYAGKDNAVPYLVDGIRNLEYRGYDSAGCALDGGDRLIIDKDVGSVNGVIRDYNLEQLQSSRGIFHTRWATHGGVSRENAHPLSDCSGDIAVVHNGIIENWEDIKASLKGHRFSSETDTEVLPHLIEEGINNGLSFKDAVKSAAMKLKGSSSFVVLNRREKDMIAVKKGSPLVVGLGEKGNFVSSDVQSFLRYTNRVIYLHDNDLVVFSDSGYTVENLLDPSIMHNVDVVELDYRSAEKGKFEHYMLKEIYEQVNLVDFFIDRNKEDIEKAASLIKKSSRVYFVGSGTSYHASLYGARLLRKLGVDAVAVQGQELENYDKIRKPSDVFVIISQSGETSDIISNMNYMAGNKKIGIINVEGSNLTGAVDVLIPMGVGVEKAVAATKSFTASLVIIRLIGAYLSDSIDSTMNDLKLLKLDIYNLNVPSVIGAIEKASDRLSNDKTIIFTGAEDGFILSLEGALKMKEVSYIHAEAFDSSAIKHGPLALIEEGTDVIAAVTNESRDIISYGLEEMKARGAHIIGISEERNGRLFDEFIKSVPAKSFDFYPILMILQMLAYKTAVKRGLDPDKPRNLAKSVTVK
ncbi:MAG: glutamine--fructose-6-phosphate transaminase (isomerizing) [Candidatus Parvarchaeota archaeon]|nr:glutamine--fructose-6-phosphate transaminase (isomerizing) [Candidatus Parvarchaeota archaeon]